MSRKRTIALCAACGALVVWIAAASTSGIRSVVVPPPINTTATDASSTELAAEVTRLRERLRPSAVPLQSRDLFRYGGRASHAAPSVVSEMPEPAVSASPAAVLPSPLTLVGLAEDAGDTGPVRTAILSGAGNLVFAGEGDVVAGHYRVTRIAPEGVELVDVDDSARTLRLFLK